ncbi:MAG: hypothetical protein U1A26_01795, partial [Candidatus Sungbacteria bacterium]|nr:hypothetical protein [Candidatus Sungbacteria bacterium]
MLYLLFGPDTYRSREKVREMIGQHRTKTGAAFQVKRFDAEEDDMRATAAELGASSLFSPKKLIVIERVFTVPHAIEIIIDAAASVAGQRDCIVVLWDGALNAEAKRRSARFEKAADKVQDFPLLTGVKLKQWILSTAAAHGVVLTAPHAARLAEQGGDLWGIIHYLEKCALGTTDDLINSDDKRTFKFGDAFFRSRREALGHLFALFEEGVDEFRLFGYLINYTEKMLAVKLSEEAHRPVPDVFGIHPFVAKKASGVLRGISSEQL